MTARLLLLLAALASAAPAMAQPAEPRLALIIGNAAYRDGPLKNPVNDARAVAARLGALGFTTILRENATKREMETAILEFGRGLAGSGIGLFFYAGHGLQVRGRNFLVPVDAAMASESEARVEGVDIDLVLEQLTEARNRLNLVILDACRNNPFEQRVRGAGRGLAAVDAARGTLIAYATSPGSVAADGRAGAHGLYTDELLKALAVPGLKAEEVFKRVRVGVGERSSGAQMPWESSSLTGDFVFNVTVNVAVAPSGSPAVADRDTAFWLSVKDGTDPAAYRAYLEQFPQGTYASLARLRLASLAPATGRPSPTAPFEGHWVGAARDLQSVRGCADRAALRVTVTGGTAQGTMRQPSGHESTFTWEIAGDGAVRARGVSGRFSADRFQGRWERAGARETCVFDVQLTREGAK